MKMLRLAAVFASLLLAGHAVAQQVQNHAIPIGRGGGVVGFGAAVPGTAGIPLVSSGLTLDPTFAPITNGGITPGAANTFKGTLDGVSTTDIAVPTCTGTGQAIQWTAGVGFTCVAAQPNILPQGYITPCQITSGAPVAGCTAGQLTPTGDVASATSLYYEPAFGNQIPIWDGTKFVTYTFSEAQGTLALNAAHLANTIYDVCVFVNAGSPLVVTGPAWTTSTAGAGSRGTGAGTAQISHVSGIWVNTVAITARNGATTYSVPASQCTVVGTLLVDGVNGQATFHRTAGTARRWAVDNIYNTLPIQLQAAEATASWTYASAAWRASNNTGTSNFKILSALPRPPLTFEFLQNVRQDATGTTCISLISIGINSTTTPNGLSGQFGLANSNGANVSSYQTAQAKYVTQPTIGLNQVNSMEFTTSGTGTCTFFGSSGSMLLRGEWRG